MNLKRLADKIRGFEGLKRKSGISALTRALDIKKSLFYGDDAAVLDLDRHTILFASDSINEKLVDADPYFAGYSAVLVNVNDIAAMGGEPLAVVNVLSAKDEETALELARGIGKGSKKFGVPVVGGHYNPNSSYNGIEISIIGWAPGGRVISSSTAMPGDVLIAAIDLNGALHKRYEYAWDTTTKKSPRKVQENLRLPARLAEKGLVRSGRDISNPGIIGTLGMLLENSKAGGVVELEKIPRPEIVELSHWLLVYPGFGFVFSAEESTVGEILSLFNDDGIAAAEIGRVEKTPKLLISLGERMEEVFDFEAESITGA